MAAIYNNHAYEHSMGSVSIELEPPSYMNSINQTKPPKLPKRGISPNAVESTPPKSSNTFLRQVVLIIVASLIIGCLVGGAVMYVYVWAPQTPATANSSKDSGNVQGFAIHTNVTDVLPAAKDIEENDNRCISRPCQNGGQCNDGVNRYTCNCAAGWTGINCASNNDECISNPCRNGGRCNDGVNRYTCNCAAGWTGVNCASNNDECISNPCQNGGQCFDGVNRYTCNCAAGWTGAYCAMDNDECISNPCRNGGQCNDGVNRYTCDCAAGWTGVNCASNYDECISNPCRNGGQCINGVNRYTCDCAAGWTGVNCASNINECVSRPCLNGGHCTNGINEYRCSCVAGWIGGRCQRNIDECASSPCRNGGVCLDQINRYVCQCGAGYTGTFCEQSLPSPKDCQEVRDRGNEDDGPYMITPQNGGRPFLVYCDMNKDGGGWTVFQRREDGSVDFFLRWIDYKNGFGDVNSEHWLGNTKIHQITAQGHYELRIDMADFYGNTKYAKYDYFRLGNVGTQYKLLLGSYSGTAGDSLTRHDGQAFSTWDNDHDTWEPGRNCAEEFKGAWWYVDCHDSNLNGLYLSGPHDSHANGVNWKAWRGHGYSLKCVEMKIRRAP